MDSCNAYESTCMSDVMGQTFRPGEFKLTKKAMEFCKLTKQNNLLDLGCGMGATIEFLYKNYGIHATGLDPSEKLLSIAKEKCSFADLVKGTGNHLPFPIESYDCVLAECTMSLMENLGKAIREVHRILRPDGWFVITDVYAKNPEAVEELKKSSLCSCMRGLHDLEHLQEEMKRQGFTIVLLEDCSELLKELMVKIIFSKGSMEAFWSHTMEETDSKNGEEFWHKLKLCKPGYFIMIGRKKEEHG